MPRITRLWQAGGGRVGIDLEGRPWRVLPAEVVLTVGCDVGVALDRPRARRLRRELRRHEALALAGRALERRSMSRAQLERHLVRGGASPEARRTTLAAIEGAGLVDDLGTAARRARVLAERGSGDALISWKLMEAGFTKEVATMALAGLDPEAKRAARLVENRGGGEATARYLARKGFEAEVVEEVLAGLVARDG